MKTIKNILIATVAILLLNSCTKDEKDENGYRIKYYKDKTGVGYVYSSDSLNPAPNILLHIEAFLYLGSGIFTTISSHVDYCYTDKNGKFTFKFLKELDYWDVTGYNIGFGGEKTIDYWDNVLTIKMNDIKDINSYTMDTIWRTQEWLECWQTQPQSK
jgi:hypothetical protein